MLNNFKQASQDILFDSLKTADNLIINTENNQYRFKVTDPARKLGILTGGRLGNKKYEAEFLFIIEENPNLIDDHLIKTNSKAVFMLKRDDCPIHLRTSSITNLKLFREVDSWKKQFKSPTKLREPEDIDH